MTLALRDGTTVSGRAFPAPEGFKKLLLIDANGEAAIRSFAECELSAETQTARMPLGRYEIDDAGL